MGIYESPDYEVIKKEENIEIRKYKSFNIVLYDNPQDKNADNGFRKLFGYISAENKSHQKMKMTVPVIDEIKNDYKTMSFVVPSEFKDEEVPVPENKDLKISSIEGGYFSAIRYSGIPSEKKNNQNIEKLKNFLNDKKIKTSSNFYNAYYDPPFQVPFLRRNEILVRIEYGESILDY